MNSLKSQTIEVSAAAAFAVVSVAAALTGALIGFVSARRSTALPVRRTDSPALRSDALPRWQQLSNVDGDHEGTDDRIEGIRREHELDVGLLKQEIRRLEKLLAHVTAPPRVAVSASESSAAHSESESSGRMRFSTLEELSAESGRGADRR